MVVEGIDVDALIDHKVLAEYRERGYWRSPRLFDADTTARLRRAHDRLWAGDFDYEVSFHHCLTLHGSGPNLSDAPRLCVIAHMMPGDTSYRKQR